MDSSPSLLHSKGEKPELSAPAPRSYPNPKKATANPLPTSSVICRRASGFSIARLVGSQKPSSFVIGLTHSPYTSYSLAPILSRTKKRTPFFFYLGSFALFPTPTSAPFSLLPQLTS